jgi:ribosomal protein S18 acetylase RimI-like enzyme
METTVPAGHVLRAPSAGDAAAVAALLRAREAADLGVAEMTVGELRAEWGAIEPEHDAWVVEAPDGELVAYALVHGDDLLVAVHPDATGRGLGTELRRVAERRAQGRGGRVVRQFVPAGNLVARILLLEAGWWPVHHYFLMRIGLQDAPAPPDVLVRTFDEQRDTEEVWHLIQGAYSGVEGWLPQSLEGWRATQLEKPGWDPELWLLLHDARGIVGAVLGERGESGQKRVGLISALAVAHRARGQGHGRDLVLLALDAFRRKRLRSAEAAVHGATAAAARVFESAGMTAERQTERWEKVIGI